MADVSAEFVENCGFELLRTGYTPPDGYRLLQIGEVVQKDDIFLAVNGEHWPAKRIGETVNNNRYLRRIEVEQPCAPCDSGDNRADYALPEGCRNDGGWSNVRGAEPEPWPEPQPQPELQPETTSEQLAEIEAQIVELEPQPKPQAEDTPATEYTPTEHWRVLAVGEPLMGGDEYHAELNRYVRRIEPQPQPQPQPEPQPEPQPVQVREGRWRTRGGDIKNIRPCEPLKGAYYVWPWTDGFQTFQDNGRHLGSKDSVHDLVEYLGPIEEEPEPQPQPQPEPEPDPQSQSQPVSDADQQIRLLEQANHNHVAMIGRLQSRINDLETINAAQEKTVRVVGQENTDLQHRLDVVSAEWAEQSEINRRLQSELNSDASVSRLQADRNDLAGKVITLREQLQLANDKLAQLEVLQPIAAACHTAQTMVRDMLGHMRCLLALYHTTERRDFCKLLESILEVFDNAECDEDEDEDTTTSTTTEAK